jgi:hypothetical protein
MAECCVDDVGVFAALANNTLAHNTPRQYATGTELGKVMQQLLHNHRRRAGNTWVHNGKTACQAEPSGDGCNRLVKH